LMGKLWLSDGTGVDKYQEWADIARAALAKYAEASR
jgi:hypothetical protein